MSDLIKFDYEGFGIEFEEVNGVIMANATNMCAVFGKRPNEWMRLESTKRYIAALEEKRGKTVGDYQLVTTKTGIGSGTWIHERLILKLAQWLSVDFELWCDEKISTLLKTGYVDLKPTALPKTYLEALKELIASEEAKEQLVAENQSLHEALDESEQWISIVRAAMELGISETVFNWRTLKSCSLEAGIEIKTVPCPRFKVKKLYHVSVFKNCYPELYTKKLN